MKYLILALLLVGCTPKPLTSEKSCMEVLTQFLNKRSGMYAYHEGWVITDEKILFYTWFWRDKDSKGTPVEYIAAARLDADINKNMKLYGSCVDNGQSYNLYKAKGHIR